MSKRPKKFINSNTSKIGKLPLAEVHPQFEKSLSLVSELSKWKGYEPLNWVRDDFKGGFINYMISAARRHINEFIEGNNINYEKRDKDDAIDSSVLHVEAAAYNLLMIATLYRMGRDDLDDRRLPVPHRGVKKNEKS